MSQVTNDLVLISVSVSNVTFLVPFVCGLLAYVFISKRFLVTGSARREIAAANQKIDHYTTSPSLFAIENPV